MTTIRISLDDDVDALQRIALPTIFGSGHPNYPIYQAEIDGSWTTIDIEEATHAVWDDHRLSSVDVALCAAIAADPSKLPAIINDKAQLLALYPVVISNEA